MERVEQQSSSAARRWPILALLLAISTLNYLDRQILTILAVPIKADLGLSNTEVGLMSGLAFALFYTLFGLPVARLADRWNRAYVLTSALAIWSAMTALCGAAQGFVQLFLTRVGVGIGEAGCTPPAHSMITDIAPPGKRASWLAIFALGSPLGALIGLAGGGALAAEFGWRMAFVIAGAPGLVLALVCVFVLRDPPRAVVAAAREEDTLGQLFAALRRRPSYWHLTFGVALMLFATFGQNAFLALYIGPAFNLPLPQVGVLLGLVLGVGGLIGGFLGGQAADMARGRGAGWMGLIPGFAALICAPFAVLAMNAGALPLLAAALGVTVACGAIWYGPVLASLQSLVLPHNRAMSAAIFIFIVNLIGLGLGPPAVGWIADVIAQQAALPEAESLRFAIMGVSIAYVWAAFHFFAAARSLAKDFAS